MNDVLRPQEPLAEGSPPVTAPYDSKDIRAWVMIGLILLAASATLISIFSETANAFVDNWHQASFNHGFLIVPISLYVVWERRALILPQRPKPTLWSILPAIGFAAAWMLGNAVDVNIVQQAALLGLIQTLIFGVLGWQLTWMLLFPILYLVLVLPLGESLYPILQDIATQTSVFFLSLTPLPVFNEDTVIQVPSGVYRVAVECAGLNFLLATIALSSLYGRLMYQGWLKPFLCIAIMIPIAVFGNGFRIFLIIFANDAFGGQIDIVADHYFYGWGFIAIILFIMMWVGLAFGDPEPKYDVSPDRSAWNAASRSQLMRVGGTAAVLALLATAAPTWAAYRVANAPTPPSVHLTLPDSFGAWSPGAPRSERQAWKPVFPDADVALLQTYAAAGKPEIDLYVAYYANQGPKKEVVSFRNIISQYNDWIRRGMDTKVTASDKNAFAIQEERLVKDDVARLIWYAYWIDGRFTPNQHMAKALQAKSDLLGGDRRAAFIAISAVVKGGDQEDVQMAMQAFLNDLPPLHGMLDGATSEPQPEQRLKGR